MSIFQPSNVIKLTNVSVIRLRKKGKRFEIAGIPNKVTEYRNGVETNVEEVLQVHTIFTNVSKGQTASLDEVEKCFGTRDINTAVMEILRKGEVQVSTQERNNQLDALRKEIVNLVVNMSINPSTNRPYTTSIIDKCFNDINYNIQSQKSSKVQAIEIIKLIKEKNIVPINRAKMRLMVRVPVKDKKVVKDKLTSFNADVIHEDFSDEYVVEFTIDPGHYKSVIDLTQNVKGGRVDLLSVNNESDTVSSTSSFTVQQQQF
ncbi:hypothetical protein MP228_009742 [Amoeboaphelidium protococcarum]|nr:hypothetical protein MP228_009742 [Amoeboaphelidium protococcarum]